MRQPVLNLEFHFPSTSKAFSRFMQYIRLFPSHAFPARDGGPVNIRQQINNQVRSTTSSTPRFPPTSIKRQTDSSSTPAASTVSSVRVRATREMSESRGNKRDRLNISQKRSKVSQKSRVTLPNRRRGAGSSCDPESGM